MVNRVGGLASGMDIDALVEKLMSAEKVPLNKLYQQKQTYEWQRDAYRDVNKQLKAFDDFLSKNMLFQKDLYKKTVTSSNSAVASATASSAANGSITISKVTQLATAGSAVGKVDKVDKYGADVNGSTKLTDLGIDGDKTIKLEVLQNDGKMKTVDFEVNGNTTLDEFVKELNNKHGLNAFYDKESNSIALATDATGKGVDIKDSSGNSSGTASIIVSEGLEVFGALGFDKDKGKYLATGTNAEVEINGATISRQSNTFEINGFNITLNDTYDGAKAITLTAQTDVDNTVNKIKEFVETYNGLVESLNEKIKEKNYRDYQPLTEEQKADMEKDEIEKWEEKAKSGILRSDSMIRGGLASLRGILYETGGSTNAALDTLYELGITTTKDYSNGGKLEIDEEKLRAAITKDPEAVVKTFTNTVTASNPGEEGIVQKLRSSMGTFTTNIEKKAGKSTMTEQNYSIGKSLVSIEDRINAWKTKLANIESRYWKQFTSMETAINKANQQSSLFMQQ